MDRLLPLLPLVLLSACGEAAAPQAGRLRDPAIMGALSEPLLSDPDLVGASRNGTMLSGGGAADGGLPLFAADEREAARAREEAVRLAGGPIEPLPPADGSTGISAVSKAATAAGVAAAVPFAASCARSLTYSFAWAARLPDALPVYPRAHAQESGGSDADGCKLRVVNFRTPVSVNDVAGFYHARAARAGLVPRVSAVGGDQIVSGGVGGLLFAVHARKMVDGMTEVDLVTNG